MGRAPLLRAPGATGEDGPIEAQFSKRLHVSPFNPMEQTYTLRAGDPGETLNVSIANDQDGERVHDAGLTLRRREMSRAAMSRVLIRHPASAMPRSPASTRTG